MSIKKKLHSVIGSAEKMEKNDDAFRLYKEMADFLDKNFAPVVATPQTGPYLPELGKLGKDVSVRPKTNRMIFLRN